MSVSVFDMKKAVVNVSKMKKSHTPGYNPLPKWCVAEPEITEEVAETVSKIWGIILKGESKAMRELQRALKDKDATLELAPTPTTPLITSRSLAGGSITTPRPSSARSILPGAVDENETKHTAESTAAFNLVDKQIANKAPATPSKEIERKTRIDEHHRQDKKNAQNKTADAIHIFVDVFYKLLFEHDQELCLTLSGDMKFQTSFLLKLCKLIVASLKKTDDDDFQKELLEFIRTNNEHHIYPKEYDTIGTMLFASLKKCVGPEEWKINELKCWKLAYNRFLLCAMPYVESPQTLLIQQKPIPTLSSDTFSAPPSVEHSDSKKTLTFAFVREKDREKDKEGDDISHMTVSSERERKHSDERNRTAEAQTQAKAKREKQTTTQTTPVYIIKAEAPRQKRGWCCFKSSTE